MANKLTNANVKAIPVGARVTDTDLQGFCANGIKGGVSFSYRYASPIYKGRHREITIGTDRDGLSVERARKIARDHAATVSTGRDPKIELEQAQAAQAKADNAPTIHVAFDRYKDGANFGELRSRSERENFFNNWILPGIGEEKLHGISRATISKLLAGIRKRSSAHVEAKAYRYLSAFFNWCALQDETLRMPLAKGMVKYSPRDHARGRTLDVQELKDLWNTLASTEEPYASLVRMLLVTAARRSEIAELRWSEVREDRIVIPAERMKAGVEHTIPITPAIAAILKRFAPEVGKPKPAHFVFSTTAGKAPFSGFSKAKERLDTRLTAVRNARDEDDPVPDWHHHDLRRTARTLMSEAGVAMDIAERVLAHQMGVVHGTYDTHSYFEQKRDALTKLAELIEKHVGPIMPDPKTTAVQAPAPKAAATNVIQLQKKKKKA